MKIARHAQIIKLISQYDIETQEELAEYLTKEGFQVTQATVSRDIRELKLTKVAGEGGRQKYAPILTKDLHVSSKYRRVLSEAILHMEDAGNLLVIKTVSGMAMACGAAIDSISMKGVIGCIAGDDTLLCVVKDAAMVPDVINEIQLIIKGLE